mmetsp:Transcript_19383/g.42137  ORF Transcript_19383/g.42137 Transcript_19383/m.42137 type:complete len:354 (+) Transcript_19383:90-1151(+)
MSGNNQNEEGPIQCFFRISVGGETLENDIVIELDTINRPKTCRSFLALCSDNNNDANADVSSSAKKINTNDAGAIRTNRQAPQPTYRGCEFHRVVPGLCVQAGDWERFDGTGGFSPLYGRNWNDEERKSNKHDREGIVSMANTGKPNTNGSQFFVTLKPTPHLDGKHVVFGKVVSGMESIRKMVDVERGEKDRPVSLQRIVIEDCGRYSSNKEVCKRSRSKGRKHKEKKELKKKRKKKRDRKSHRYSESISDSDSDSNDDYGNDDNASDDRRRRHSRKSRKRKRRRRNYENHDSSDNDESFFDSSSDGSRRNCNESDHDSGQKRSIDGEKRRNRKGKEHKKRSRQHEKRSSTR